MGRVLTNNVSFAYTIETALGVAGTSWFLLEPNAINSFGANTTTVARSPISRNRQRRKGTITDLDSAAEFDTDLGLSAFRDFIEGFTFVTGINSDVTQLATTAAETTGDSYAVVALTAAQADKFEWTTLVGGSLIWVNGFDSAANNGLHMVDADIATSATAISTDDNLVDETAPAAGAQLSFAGWRSLAGTNPSWTYTGPTAVLGGVTGLGTQLIALGLTAGQVVHIGSVATLGGSIQNAFQNSVANDMFGYARVVSIAADSITFDKVDAALQFTDAALATDLDILFGEFFRNVPTTSAEFLERSFQFEATLDNLDTGGADMYEYSKGNYCNQAAFNLPLTDKASVTFGFIGTDTDVPVSVGSRKTGASAATDPTQTAALNTTADIARLRVTQVDETGITTDFKSLTFTLNNNVSPEKVLGQLGAKYMNTGNFEVNIETQLIFSDAAVPTAIRNNTTVTMDFVLKNDDGVIAVDVPSMTMGDGSRDYPVNESVLINVTGEAFQDATLGTSVGISLIPVPLP